MQADLPITQDIVLIGGGHTHALVLKSWAMAPLPGARLTLINPGPKAAYSGMLPGHIAGHYARDELDIDLIRLARFAGARIVLGAVSHIDPEAQVITVPGRAPIGYDLASLDIGIHARMPEIAGFEAHAQAAKPLDGFADRWSAFLAQGGGSVAVIGAGIAGVELALAARHRLQSHFGVAEVSLIDRSAALESAPPKARATLLAELEAQGIPLIAQAEIVEITASHVALADGRQIAAQFTLGAAGARPHAWLEETGLALSDGYVSVSPTLASASHPTLFASGDCAHLVHAPRPKAGVFAVRAAPVLAHNLRAMARGEAGQMRAFKPQRDYLKLISLGDQRAVAEKGGWALKGPALWRWKDRIDRRFMERLSKLDPMSPLPLPQEAAAGVAEMLDGKPLCGGCGAKLAPARLHDALQTLPAHTREDVLSLPGDDAAHLNIAGQSQILTTDHLRGFTPDPGLLARVAAIHALGDCWAMGAAPQAALASITLPRISEPLQARWLQEIMAEAAAVFVSEGAEIVGGHSAMGAELSIGFTLTGLPEAAPITLAGAEPGDVVVMTKSLGTGVILAAEMQLAARGEEVAGAWAQMGESSGPAARILAREAKAMTDITGFGLAGHLMNICRASGVTAELRQDKLPLLAGAERLLLAGHASAIHGANASALMGRISGQTPAPILFDPQTSGGLLAAFSPEAADRAQIALSEAGIANARIARITKGAAALTLI